MKEIDVAWLAGLLEGEGNFEFVPVAKKAMDVRINISMADRDVIERVAAITEATSKVRIYDRRGQAGFRQHHQPLHCLCIRGYRAIRVMKQILPFMGNRRSEKIKMIIEAWDGANHTRERHLPPTCHPDRRHYCQGLCRTCYSRMLYAKKQRIKTVYALSGAPILARMMAMDSSIAFAETATEALA
jgi:hypothetical protein